MSDVRASAVAAGSVCLPPAMCIALCEGLPRAADLDTAMRVVEGVRHELLGEGLLTVNLLIKSAEQSPDGRMLLQRAWSSDPVAYPPGGLKYKSWTPWSRQLLQDGRVFVGEGDADLARAFDDHALIVGLGLHGVVNVPLLDTAQHCYATFNVLGPRDHWRADEVLLVRLLATLVAPAIARVVRNVVTPVGMPDESSTAV